MRSKTLAKLLLALAGLLVLTVPAASAAETLVLTCTKCTELILTGKDLPANARVRVGVVDVKDKSCIEECPVDCIYEGDRMLYIHPDECVDCGACEPVCPVEAIFYEDDVPAQWKDFTATNAAFFTEGDDPLGSPGGAAKVGPQVRDTEYVASYTPTE